MKKTLTFLGVFVLCLLIAFYLLKHKTTTSTSFQKIPTSSPTLSQEQLNDIPKETIIADHLNVPWAIGFLPDGSLLVTQRPGQILKIGKDGEKQTIGTISVDVKKDGEGGLLGLVLHPQFNSNHYVYFYYTYKSSGSETLNKVVRMKFENNSFSKEEVIVDKIPGALYHNGGRIKFGPDNYLYITTGDSQASSLAQNTNSLAGKILRVTDDGKPASGNPFNNLIYSYGHRNPQGITWDTNGNLFATEHGRSNPTGFDELNFIQNGKNYGWPTIQGDEAKTGMETPLINSGPVTTWAPSGAVFFNGSVFFAGLKGQTLYQAIIQQNRVVELKKHLVGMYGRLREVVIGPDSMLYITTSNRDGRGNPSADDDKIIRINPQKL